MAKLTTAMRKNVPMAKKGNLSPMQAMKIRNKANKMMGACK